MSAPSMPLFCGDYLKDTTDLTLEEHGAFLMILMITWAQGGRPLPDDDARMATRLRITKERWVKKIRPVLAPLFDLSGGTWRNERLEREWNYVQKQLAIKRANGAKGGRPADRGPDGGPGNSQNSEAIVRRNTSGNGAANHLENNETSKATGSETVNLHESTHTYTSSVYTEEIGGAVCVTLDQSRAPAREAPHTQAPPVFSEKQSSNIVQFPPSGGRQALPAAWVLPDEWRAWADAAGQRNIDGAARRFAVYWRGRGAKTEDEWRAAWQLWITENIERGYGDGRKSNNGYGQQDNGVTALAKSGYFCGSDDTESDPHDGRRRFV